jgi:competence protein ComEA
MKKQTGISIIICIVFLAVSGVFYLRSGQQTAVTPSGESYSGWSYETTAFPTQGAEASGDTECTVYICGAVKHPGVYTFPDGSRVCDAVTAAGGLTKKAADGSVNQARVLVDGEQITIPKKSSGKAASSGADGDSSGSADASLVNINQADLSELMTLSGIGEAKAQLILSYREENGSFQTKEDIMNISGIKEGIYNQIKDSITV